MTLAFQMRKLHVIDFREILKSPYFQILKDQVSSFDKLENRLREVIQPEFLSFDIRIYWLLCIHIFKNFLGIHLIPTRFL